MKEISPMENTNNGDPHPGDPHPILAPRGAAAISHEDNHIRRETWGDGENSVSMLSALVPGAKSIADCEEAGWPLWLADSCYWLFKTNTGEPGKSEREQAIEFARETAQALSQPVDMQTAQRRFNIALLEEIKHLDRSGAVIIAQTAIRRQVMGDSIDPERAINDVMKALPFRVPPKIHRPGDRSRTQIREAARSAINGRAEMTLLRAGNALQAGSPSKNGHRPLPKMPETIPASFRAALTEALRSSAVSRKERRAT